MKAAQRVGAAFAVKAAQADAVATIMSTPYVLRGEVDGRSTRGVASVTLAEGGKAMTRDRGTDVEMDTVALHCKVVLVVAIKAVELQAPAVAAVVEALAQHAQEAQPRVCSAGAAQQQPPRHRLVPQSAGEAQASPGELSRQVPVLARQVAQPARAALGEQQKPPRQAEEAQEALEVQGAPGREEPAAPPALEVALALPVAAPR